MATDSNTFFSLCSRASQVFCGCNCLNVGCDVIRMLLVFAPPPLVCSSVGRTELMGEKTRKQSTAKYPLCVAACIRCRNQTRRISRSPHNWSRKEDCVIKCIAKAARSFTRLVYLKYSWIVHDRFLLIASPPPPFPFTVWLKAKQNAKQTNKKHDNTAVF